MKILLKLAGLSVIGGELKIFLKDNHLPFRTLIGNKQLDKIIKDIFKRNIKTSIENEYLEQLYTFSYPGKIVISYYILVPGFSIDSSQIGHWRAVGQSIKNCPDKRIIEYAAQRLRWKVEYTNVVYSLLAKKFTLSELQQTYEIILGRSLDKRNFRKKILSLGILKDTGEKKSKGPARPAEIYEFKTRRPFMVEVF